MDGTGKHDLPSKLLSIREAVPLAHAFVARLGVEREMDLVLIKGPIAEGLGLRPPRDSSDVDVLVRPSQQAKLVEALGDYGWRKRGSTHEKRILPLHAVHLIHDEWPCDIDVHVSYPGFFAAEDDAFELLWRSSETYSMCGIEVNGLAKGAAALIQAAHLLRDPKIPKNELELKFLQKSVDESFSREEIDLMVSLATHLTARETLAPFLEALGQPALHDLSPHQRRLWAARTSDRGGVLSWWLQLTDAPRWTKLEVLRQAVFPSEQIFRTHNPHTPPGRSALYRARVKRIVLGFRMLYPALIDFRKRLRE